MCGVGLLAYLLLTAILNPMTRAVDKGVKSMKIVMENFSHDDEIIQEDISEAKDTINSVETTLNIMSQALENTIIREKKINEELIYCVCHLLIVTILCIGDHKIP